ncbi:NADPH-dependent FMN reductase [Streptomyces odontomachi]|uniref:NADPH-dependent FMN reductase n=1 Tax=Streptomyces odontomachi TaxID=2944940 RepID=UPI002108F954|nr:NAD(P)H-dependent oxidoreductase [Streptomyces sp. ODS25]
MNGEGLRVLGFAGSLRAGSYNRMLLHAAQKLAPEGMTVEIADLAPIPLFNQDVEQQGDPEPVTAFKQQIMAADALLIVTPEYQHGMPGVLKNALDWASRPSRQSPMQGKPVAIMGASPGMTGTSRAQPQLRQTLTYNGCYAVPQPEVLVSRAHERFDDGGRLTDRTAAGLVRQVLGNLSDLTRRLAPK